MLTTHRTRVAVLCSGRAPGLAYLLERRRRVRVDWDVVCVLTSENSFEGEAEVRAYDVPVRRHPIKPFYAAYAPHKRVGDLSVRAMYDAETVRLLRAYRPDLVVLAGYLRLLTSPMLDAYPERIINVHHSDLADRDSRGLPRYPGLRAVRDAILAGEVATRCSAHLVTVELDSGPMLLRSRAYPVPDVARWALLTGEQDLLRKVIWAHQEWMLRDAFGPLMEKSIEAVASLEPVR
jgi:folate-dependent phosphoribosylglycinamide formyltransferase PurN